MSILSVADSGTSFDWTGLAQYGVLGLVVVAFVVGKIVPGYVYERRVEEHHAAQEENKKLEDTIKDRVIPALIGSTDVMAQVLALLPELEKRSASRSRQAGQGGTRGIGR